jgi:hypothetical protein
MLEACICKDDFTDRSGSLGGIDDAGVRYTGLVMREKVVVVGEDDS